MARGGHGEEQSIWTRAKAGRLEEHEHRQGESHWSWLCSCVTCEGHILAGTSLGHEQKDPLNLLRAKIAAIGLPATGKPKRKELVPC